MKILMVNRKDAFSNYGGDTTQMLETQKELQKRENTVDIALGPQKIDKYNDYDLVHLFNIQTSNFSYKEGIKIKKTEKPLVLSPIWWDFHDIYYDYLIQYAEKNRNFIYSSLIKINTKRRKFLEKTTVKHIQEKLLIITDSILPNSFIENQKLIDYYSVDKNKINVVYNGVSNDFLLEKDYELPNELEDLNINSKEFALQVGGIHSGKNVISSIKACKRLDIPLVIIGEGQYKEYLTTCKRNSGKKTYFLGYKKNTDIIPYYNHAKLHILPSFRETPGLSSLEAGASGCNIVTTNIGSTEEYFGEHAFYCDPFSLQSIINAIKLAWDKENDNILKNIIKNKYTWKKAASKTLDCYKKIL